MPDSWPISRRVSSGFFLLTAMLVGLALFSHRSVGTLGDGYSEYRYIARQNVAINAYVEDIFEARTAALKYRYSPSDALRAEVVSNINEVLEETDFLERFNDTPARRQEVERLVATSAQYRDGFLEMSGHRGRASQIRAAFNERTTDFKEQIGDIFSATVQRGSPATVAAAGRTLQAAMNAIIQSKRYLSSADPADLRSTSRGGL